MSRYKIIDGNGIYFTTHTIVEWLPVFKETRYFEILIESLKHCQKRKGLIIYGYVIMLNHFHLMAQTEEGIKFSGVMRDLKKHTSKKISRKLEKDNEKLLLYVFKKTTEKEKGSRNYKIWQDDYHPQIINTDEICRQKLEYMHYNPVRKGFVEQMEFWKYSSARNYLLDDDSVLKVELMYLL